ncbi:PREDICTED: protein IQ-DOMAIN 14-like isoform X1 [Ipomoea nil]|uniref:protein IQ-DOMAIN 14-like isoform X1 n=1 Tax=Ipomoea nil TaxID=35883 RepID=UPI0009011903|nr:PREDICTED: protein IQ-DOMAIN 14-like isoform X1 [Ipomoea nil]
MMGKRRSWFAFVKRLFIQEAKSKSEKRPRRWKWFSGKIKLRQRPAIEAPIQKTLCEAAEDQRKHALAVAVATAAAAEAAVAAANAAAEVVRLTNAPYEFQKRQTSAATKIQTAFRAYLARKALSALKGLVKLQAVIRGEIVRRRLIAKLKCMLSFPKSQPQVHHKRVAVLEQPISQKEILKPHEVKCQSHRTWDFTLASVEDAEALWFRRQDAITKRERMMKYSLSQRERRNDETLQELLTNKENQGSCRFDQWGESGTPKRTTLADKLRSFAHSNVHGGDMNQMAQVQGRYEELNSPLSLPRRSFSLVKHKSTSDDSSLPDSPMFPPYMAATESAKAKMRSMSTPKQRVRLYDTCSCQHSPHKLSLSSWSSFNDETSSTERNWNFSASIRERKNVLP